MAIPKDKGICPPTFLVGNSGKQWASVGGKESKKAMGKKARY